LVRISPEQVAIEVQFGAAAIDCRQGMPCKARCANDGENQARTHKNCTAQSQAPSAYGHLSLAK
jgi:hypothetical protein